MVLRMLSSYREEFLFLVITYEHQKSQVARLAAGDGGAASKLTSLARLHDNHADVIFAAVLVRQFHQPVSGSLRVADVAQHLLDLRVTNHLPQAIAAHQQLIAG